MARKDCGIIIVECAACPMKGLEEATGAGKRGVVNENGLAVASPCSSRQLELMEKVPDRPRQAVILAGGRGVRLRPITDARPKPMIEFHGKPFLQYLVEMLRDQEFERIVLLLGYLPDVIIDHFGDGRDSVSISPTPLLDPMTSLVVGCGMPRRYWMIVFSSCTATIIGPCSSTRCGDSIQNLVGPYR